MNSEKSQDTKKVLIVVSAGASAAGCIAMIDMIKEKHGDDVEIVTEEFYNENYKVNYKVNGLEMDFAILDELKPMKVNSFENFKPPRKRHGYWQRGRW